MKFLLGVVVALVLAVIPLTVSDASAQDTNNFRITSFDIQYDLSKDDSRRSILKTTETITAEFPNYDQNHGLVRTLPTHYKDHPVSLDIVSVTNGEGKNLDYSIESINGTDELRIGDPDKYVQGLQVYKITYTQRDVTYYFANTDGDEWYWDTNGTDWKVPIDELTITARIDDSLFNDRQGEPVCYQGAAGEDNKCSIIQSGESDYSVVANNLAAGENVTIAFGFTKGAFAPYEPSVFERILAVWLKVFIVTSIIGVIGLILLIVAYARKQNRTREITTIVTEYIPPKNSSVTLSAGVITPKGSTFAAQLIDFAVRHFIEIIETKPAKSVWQTAEYDIKIITDPKKLQAEEQEILRDMFGKLPRVGSRLALSKLSGDYAYYTRTLDNDKKLKALVEGAYALRHTSYTDSRFFYKWGTAFLIVGLITFSPVLLVFALIIALLGKFLRPLTDKGLELRRYLLGLDKYIKAAEVERLKFLQGPDTTQKIGETVNVEDAGQLVKLYERVLPYAILFGREKEWSKQLGEVYVQANANPSWYSSPSVFNAVLFSSAVNSFSSAAATSGGSSSSGGSAGGGSSGGGGGGGGGGGW
jgi:uncharacterized membrane protein YgcG